MYLKHFLVLAMCVGSACAHAEEHYKAVDTDDIGSYWIPEKRVHHDHLFPESARRKHIDVCVAVAFTIEPDGSSRNVQVLRSETSKPADVDETKRVAAAAAESVARMHYEPASANRARLPIFSYTAVSMSVANSGTTAAIANKHNEEVAKSCHVKDFVAAASTRSVAAPD